MIRRVATVLLALLPGLALAAPRTPVTIRAYLNVSSGCQAATVDFLNALKARYAPEVKLEMVDFGDEGKGLKRWRAAGLRCQTIEINGSALVKFVHNAKPRVVAFRMPAGLQWTHTDLEQAVQAGLRGELQPATEAEVAASARPVTIKATVRSSPLTQGGQPFIAVRVNGVAALLVPVGDDRAAATRRAAAAVAVLQSWLSQPVKLADLRVTPTASGAALVAAGKTVLIATAADSKRLRQPPLAVAEGWLAGLHHALAARTN